MKGLDIEQIYELYLESGGVCTDTRKIFPDCMFFALKGETFDGNQFAASALGQGAAWAVVDDPHVESICSDSMIYVEDVLVTLQLLARHHRLRYKIPVLALTGTNGKTTTKELIAATLRTKYNVVSTRGNLNNHIGVPLTLLEIDEGTQVAVIEMGASHPGEIESLARIVCPSFGLITNVGKAHLQGFGDFEGVKATKGELYDNLDEHHKIAFVNVDNPHLMEMVRKRPQMHIVPYGVKNDGAEILCGAGNSPFLTLSVPNPCYTAVEQDGDPERLTIGTRLIGSYNVDNVLAALCVSSYLAVPAADAIAAIEGYSPANNRSQLAHTGKNTLIIDAYNANPTSMKAALDNFSTLDMPGKTAILGDMLELGLDSIREHEHIVRTAVAAGVHRIFLVGDEFAKAYAVLEGSAELDGAEIRLFADVEHMRMWMRENAVLDSTVLVKGSHGIHLERLLDVL